MAKMFTQITGRLKTIITRHSITRQIAVDIIFSHPTLRAQRCADIFANCNLTTVLETNI